MSSLSPVSGSPASPKNEITASIHSQTVRIQAPSGTKSKSKPRKRVTTDEKRSQHNAIERARRNTLNGRFTTLGRLIPSLASHRNPSKSAVVNGSIGHLTYQREQRLLAAKIFRRICPEHDALLAEVNHWRKMYGQPLKEGASAWTSEVDEICSVDKEVFGTFDTMEGDDDDNDDGNDYSFDNSAINAPGYANVSGIITPRSSTELDLMGHQQAMFAHGQVPNQSMPIPDKRTATVNGMAWSNDFASSVNSINTVQRQNSMNTVASGTTSVPFPSVMSDPLDQSASASPANSHQGVVLTPPTTAEFMYTHTPSPASTHSVQLDDKAQLQHQHATQSWNQQQQLLFLQQQMHQQPQQQQFANAGLSAAFAQFQHQQSQQMPNTNVAGFTNETFEQLLAGMFPNGATNTVQLQQWCQDVVQHAHQSHVPTGYKTQTPLPHPGMSLGLNMGMWDTAQVTESF